MELIASRTPMPDLSAVEPLDWSKTALGRPLRVLFVSDAIWSMSGYGKQALYAVAILHRLGAEVAALSSYGLQGQHMELATLPGVKIYPGGNDAFANDVIPLASNDWRADVTITLKDTPVFNIEAMRHTARWSPMTPIDHDPIPPAVMQALRNCWQPIAYAAHGFKAMRKAGMNPLYLPHTYNDAIMKPLDKAAVRAEFGWAADRKVVTTVAVNRGGYPSRKAWPQLMEAMGYVVRDDPSVVWYCHTSIAQDGFEAGVNLEALTVHYGLQRNIVFPDQAMYRYRGFSEEHMAKIYAASDALLAVSIGEGFGVPILEAQACGTPVIVGDWTAPEDLCFAGVKVPKEGALSFTDNQGANVYIPLPGAVAEAVLECLRIAPSSEQAVQGAQDYSIPSVAKEWAYALTAMSRRIEEETKRGRGVQRIIRPEEVLWR
jgi:glycosyltransferase involved in cell wall biosynthesis